MRSKVNVGEGDDMNCSKCLDEFVLVRVIGGRLVPGDIRILFRGMELHEWCFQSMNVRWSDDGMEKLDEMLVHQDT